MSESEQILFDCPSCGKHFLWRPALVGKKIKCPCGAVMIGPAAPGDVYDVVEEPAMAQPVVLTSRVAPTPGAMPASLEPRVLGYRSKGAKKDTALEADVVEFTRLKDFWLPIGLAAFGLVLQIGIAVYDGIVTGDLMPILGATLTTIAINVVLFFLAMLFAVKLLDIPFGEPFSAVLKLCAIALAPSGVAAAIAYAAGNDWFSRAFAGICIQPGLAYILFVLLFGLEVGQVLMCVVLTYLVYEWITPFFVQKLFPTDL